MKIKKYTAANMPEAMKLIKEDLGPNAVIVSTEQAPRKNIRDFLGPRQLIITAAVEEQVENLLSRDAREKHVEELPGARLPAALTVYRTTEALSAGGEANGSVCSGSHEPFIPKDIVPTSLPEPLVDFAGENRDAWFKLMVNNVVDQMEGEDMNSPAAKWGQILKNMEIHDKIVELLLSEITDTGENDNQWEDREEIVKVSLKKNIVKLVDKAYKNNGNYKIKTFIGPTGVGKTTTLVKMATRYKVFHQKDIALIALYNHRFGALEELSYYAEIIGVPVEVVMTPGELDKAVQKHAGKDYILIDTEGRPSKNKGQILELKTFIDAIGNEQDILLVLSATTKNRDIMRIANDFSRVGTSRMVFTKLDETDTLGSMLNAICEVGAPVSYITRGQNIPDDIEAVTPKKLAGILLEGFDSSEKVEF